MNSGDIEIETSPSVKYYNGVTSPQVHFGTFRIKTTEDVEISVTTALETGYRAIDTASVYKNQTKISDTLNTALPHLGLTRRDIFITSKLAPKDHGLSRCEESIKNILHDLKTDYLDLFLIHWPGVQKLDVQDPNNRVLRQESWRVLEKYYKAGVLRAIGVSNYTISHMKQLLEECEVVPHVVQLELHPHYQQRDLVQYCRDHNLHVQAYSSLGAAGAESPLYTDETVVEISESTGRTPAQVLLRWGVQRGFTVMPKSVTPSRIRENFDLNFSLTQDQMEALDCLGDSVNQKYTWNPEDIL